VVSRSLCRLLGSTHEVEDIVQEVFLRVFNKLDGLKDPRALRAFIFSITLRTTRWQRRRRWIRRRIYSAPTESLPTAITACEDFEARQAVARFARILDNLSDWNRTAFTLHHIEGFSVREVADAMQVSLGTLKRRLSQAIAKVELLARRDPALMDYLSTSTETIRDEP
jgi:RNA polymerase sigma-70 factor (ECF subfamily)